MEKVLKTKTLTDGGGNPVFTYLKGRHTVSAFNKAFVAEGWDHGNWQHGEWGYKWVRFSKTRARITDEKDLKAEICTVGMW